MTSDFQWLRVKQGIIRVDDPSWIGRVNTAAVIGTGTAENPEIPANRDGIDQFELGSWEPTGGGYASTQIPVLESHGAYRPQLGYGDGLVSFQWGAGGFSAYDGDLNGDGIREGLTVTARTGADEDADLTWNGSGGFNSQILALNSLASNGVVELTNNIELNADQEVRVFDNVFSEDDYAIMSGVISESDSTMDLTKSGPGRLVLSGDNTMTGWLRITEGSVALTGTNNFSGGGIELLNGATLELYQNAGMGVASSPLRFGDGTVVLHDGFGSVTRAANLVSGGSMTFDVQGAADSLTLSARRRSGNRIRQCRAGEEGPRHAGGQ